jgi:DNA-binding MarR family transcriptional regulator
MTLPELGLSVKRLQVKNHRAATEALKPLGITLVQWDALRHLHQNPGASLHDLAVLTFQTDQAFGTLAARLEARGLIRRASGAGRAIRPELTPEGERLRAEGAKVTERVIRKVFAPLDAHEREVLGGMLERLLAE